MVHFDRLREQYRTDNGKKDRQNLGAIGPPLAIARTSIVLKWLIVTALDLVCFGARCGLPIDVHDNGPDSRKRVVMKLVRCEDAEENLLETGSSARIGFSEGDSR